MMTLTHENTLQFPSPSVPMGAPAGWAITTPTGIPLGNTPIAGPNPSTDTPPDVVGSIENFYRWVEDAPDATVDLWDVFEDDETDDEDLIYSWEVTEDGEVTEDAAAVSISFDPDNGRLTLDFDEPGIATVKVTATDAANGESDEVEFEVTVLEVTGMSVERQKPDGSWEEFNDIVLWDDDILRWTPEINPSEVEIDAVHWDAADWAIADAGDVLASDWTTFAEAPCIEPKDDEPPESCLAIGNPGSGRWAVTPTIFFGGGTLARMADPEEKMVYAITEVTWVGYDQYTDGKSNFIFNSPDKHEFWPEFNIPPTQPNAELHDKIYVQVRIEPAAVAGRLPTVYLKSLDPDHQSNDPSWDPDDSVDNLFGDLFGGNEILGYEPNDNVLAGGGDADDTGGASIVDAVTFEAGKTTVRPILTVNARQPDNNFIVAVSGRADRRETFSMDPKIGASVIVAPGEFVDDRFATEHLTIYRTLHVEFDAMQGPVGFDGNGPNSWDPEEEDDVRPDENGIPALDAHIGAIQRIFVPAAIWATNDLAQYETKADPLFVHNLHDTKFTEVGNDSRDVASHPDYWVVQIVAAYEAQKEEDHDEPPDSSGLYGRATLPLEGDNPILVFTETIRDSETAVRAFCDNKKPAPGLLGRIVPHEVVHRFDLYHGETHGDDGPLDYDNSICEAVLNHLTGAQLATVQGVEKPD